MLEDEDVWAGGGVEEVVGDGDGVEVVVGVGVGDGAWLVVWGGGTYEEVGGTYEEVGGTYEEVGREEVV